MKRSLVILAGFVAGAGIGALAVLLFFPSRGPTSSEDRASFPGFGPATVKHMAIPDGPAGLGVGEDSPSAGPAHPSTRVPPSVHPGDSPPPSMKESGLAFLRGRILFGKDGPPLSRILVLFSRAGFVYLASFTDGSGRFSVGLPGGMWGVDALPFGAIGIHSRFEVNLKAGETKSLDIVVPDRGIFDVSGCVTVEGVGGVGGVKVTLSGGGKTRVEEAEMYTGIDGHYAFRRVEVRFPEPTSRVPGSVEDFSFNRPMVDDRGVPNPYIWLTFARPDLGEQKEHRLLRSPGGAVRCDAAFEKKEIGRVTGTLRAPHGEDLDGKSLPFRLVKDGKTGRLDTRIEGNRFTIKIPQLVKFRSMSWLSGDEGRLIAGGLVGRLWLDDVDLGQVDRRTRKDGIVLKPRAVPVHYVDLLDMKGGRVSHGPDIQAWITGKEGRRQDLEVEETRIVVPLFFEGSRTLTVKGIDFETKAVRISPEELPPNMTVEVLPLLMTGTIRFPKGFEDWNEVSVSYEYDLPDRHGGSSRKGLYFDRDTGVFRLKRPFTLEDCRKWGWEAEITVEILIPGHEPWVKKDIRVKWDETMEGVVVTFE